MCGLPMVLNEPFGRCVLSAYLDFSRICGKNSVYFALLWSGLPLDYFFPATFLALSISPVIKLMTSSTVQYPLVARLTSALPLLTAPTAFPARVAPTPRPRKPRWPKLLLLSLVFLTAFIGLINVYNVDKTVTAEDRHYIQLYMPGYAQGCAPKLTYAEQIKVISLAQQRVGERTKGWAPIPENYPREPKQLYEGQTGQCFDRSRVLEKIYLYLGFETRHLSLFVREPMMHSWQTVLFRHVQSHAISEVLTKKGWLMVDSNDLWLSLDKKMQPISMHQLQAIYLQDKQPDWLTTVPDGDGLFYNNRCIPIYGLYSRHGRFYPPYTSGIPDYRLRGLLYNLEGK